MPDDSRTQWVEKIDDFDRKRSDRSEVVIRRRTNESTCSVHRASDRWK